MKKYLKMAGLLVIYYLLPIAVILATIKVFGSIKATSNFFNKVPQMLYGVSDPVYILLMFGIFRLFKGKNLAKHSSLSRFPVKDTLIFAAFGILMGMFTYSLIHVDYVETNYRYLVDIIKSIIAGNVFLLMYTVTINSIGKELGFRGMIFNEMRDKMPVAAALVIQALLYGSQLTLSSLPMSVALYGAFGALVFGMIYYYGKSLWSSIIAQICCTFSMVLIDRTALKGIFGNMSSKLILVASVAAIIGLLAYMHLRKKAYGKDAETAFNN